MPPRFRPKKSRYSEYGSVPAKQGGTSAPDAGAARSARAPKAAAARMKNPSLIRAPKAAAARMKNPCLRMVLFRSVRGSAVAVGPPAAGRRGAHVAGEPVEHPVHVAMAVLSAEGLGELHRFVDRHAGRDFTSFEELEGADP